MKKGKTVTIVVIVLFCMLCVGACNSYNGMVNGQEAATTALADVQATYQRRADLIPNLAKTVQTYAKHERETYEAVTKARAAATQIKLDVDNLTPEKLRQFQAAQGELSQALGRLMVVAERYPELKASENFKSLQIQLEGTENRINEARQKYNMAVQEYNQNVRSFPNVLFAGAFGFERMTKFEADSGAEKAPELNFE